MADPRRIIENTLVPHAAFEHAVQRVAQCFEYAQGSSEPVCIAVLGESRTGKSRVLEECRSLHPRHRTPEGLIVPILQVTTPSKPTVKGLAELMLHAIGDPAALSGTENRKTLRLHKLMRACSTRMIMIDEFQHVYDKGSNRIMHHVADWLKILVDETRVALVVSGIPSCRAVLDQNTQLAGRFLAPAIMPRLDWNNNSDRAEYIAILGAFHESLSIAGFDLPPLNGDEMAFRCYCGTGGLIGLLAKFLRQAVWNALDDGTSIMTVSDLARAHQQAVWAVDGISTLTPFDFSTPLESRPDLVEAVTHVGRPDISEAPQPARRSRAERPKIRDVLTAR